jgi:hypothetical protein
MWKRKGGGIHIGVTPTSGAETPAYSPRLNPSRATLFLTTSIAPLYTPASAVCRRTLTRSNGWPTTTAQTPPKPPAARERTCEARAFLASSFVGGATAGSLSATASWVEDIVGDVSVYLVRGWLRVGNTEVAGGQGRCLAVWRG